MAGSGSSHDGWPATPFEKKVFTVVILLIIAALAYWLSGAHF